MVASSSALVRLRRLGRSAPATLALLTAGLSVGCGGEKAEPSGTGAKAADTSVVPTGEAATTASSALIPSAAPSGSAAAAAPAAKSGKPDSLNVLVISVDAMRADHMAFSGYESVMPNLEAFEKTAVSYTQFYSLSSFTSQTLGGFLGCRYPSELKRNGTFFGVYPEAELMFPELLQKAGVRTMSGQAHFYFAKGKAGFDQGFDVYDMVPDLKRSNTTDENITSPQHTDMILKHLGDPANTKGRFFAWYHLMDAHDMYLSHPEGKDFGKGAVKKYDGELYYVDMHLKKILDYVDSQEWGKRTMVVITADHGEAFGEHKQYRHGFELWQTLTHVPLMIRAPGVKPRRVSATRSMVDLCPTVLDSFGVSGDPSFQGVSLWPELSGADLPSRDAISDLARTGDNDRRRTLVHENFKIIEEGNADGFRLFDIKADPGEENDLTRKDKAKFEEMKGRLNEAAKGIKEICPSRTEKLKNKHKGKPC